MIVSENGHIASFARNEAGRDFVVGDIHGKYRVLEDLLESVEFDVSVDRLFSVGDLIDRGDSDMEAIDWMNSGRITASVMGNHEEMMLRALLGSAIRDDASIYVGQSSEWFNDIWRMNGGRWWFDHWEDRYVSEDTDDGKRRSESDETKAKERWISMLLGLPYAITVQTGYGDIGIVHSCPMWTQWEAFLENMENGSQDARTRAVWSRQRSRPGWGDAVDDQPSTSEGSVPTGAYRGVRAVMCGHTPEREIQWDTNLLNLDSGVVLHGVLTMASVNSEEITLHNAVDRTRRDL